MKGAAIGFSLALALTFAANVDAQKPGGSRFSSETVELFSALSQGYEVNGKPVPPNIDTAMILRASKSRDTRVAELARLACELVYLHNLMQQKKSEPEIERIAKRQGGELLARVEKIAKAHSSPAETRQLIDGIRAIAAAVGNDTKSLEALIFTEPQKDANRMSMLRLVGQDCALLMKEKMRAMAGSAGTAPAKPPVQVKLETTREQAVLVTLTNSGRTPLHHCLIFTRGVADPVQVAKQTRIDLATRVAGAELLGASKASIEATRVGVLLQAVLLNRERGVMAFVPEIPAGGNTRVQLTSLSDMAYVKSSDLSLWCDEFAVVNLSAGATAPAAPPKTAGTPLKLNARGFASVKTTITRSDPKEIDSHFAAIGNAMQYRGKVFTLKMTAGRTYTIKATCPKSTPGKPYSPPWLRVEDAAGKYLARENPNMSFFTYSGLQFTPKTSGEYRIVCLSYSPVISDFTLTVQRK